MIIFEKLFETLALLIFAPYMFVKGFCTYTAGVALVVGTSLLDIWTDK